MEDLMITLRQEQRQAALRCSDWRYRAKLAREAGDEQDALVKSELADYQLGIYSGLGQAIRLMRERMLADARG